MNAPLSRSSALRSSAALRSFAALSLLAALAPFGCTATSAPVDDGEDNGSNMSGVSAGAEDRMTFFMRCDGRKWSRGADVNGSALGWDTPWSGGDDAAAGLPGYGTVQAANNFMAGGALHQSVWRGDRHHYRTVPYDPGTGRPRWDGASGWTDLNVGLPGQGGVQAYSGYVLGNTLYEGLWRGNEGWIRHIPVVDGRPVWDQPTKGWSGPISSAGLPGGGDMQSQNDYILGGTLRQGFWRGNQGFWRDVPISGDTVLWGSATPWSAPIALSAMPCQAAMETTSSYFDYVPAAPPAQPSEGCVLRPPGNYERGVGNCWAGDHTGIDYSTPMNTEIRAGISGKVVSLQVSYPDSCYAPNYNNDPNHVYCSFECNNTRFNYIKIVAADPKQPGNDLVLWYLHINSVPGDIYAGKEIKQGDLIAYSGNSGCSTGPHIHLQAASVSRGSYVSMTDCNAFRDPEAYLCSSSPAQPPSNPDPQPPSNPDPQPSGPVCKGSSAGLYCGDDMISGGNASVLYYCGGPGQTATVKQQCPGDCVIAPQGQDDYCASPQPSGPVCKGPSAGMYCGDDMIEGGNASVLYYCAGPGQIAAAKQQCPLDCVIAPQGYDDYCK